MKNKSKWLWICGLSAVAIFTAIFVFKISTGNIFFYGLLLACPLMHIFMMKNMGHDHKK